MTATNNNEGHGFKVGDILVSEFGYSMSLVNYYQVVKTTAKTISVRQIQDEMVSHDGYGQSGWVRPIKDAFITNVYFGDKPIKRKVNEFGNIRITSWVYADKWNGKNNYFDARD